MESIEQTFNGQADFGRRVQCTISRNGDLAYRTYLQVTLPEIGQSDCDSGKSCFARWLDYPGEQLISMVEVEIGGQRIDRQYGDWMHIWNQLTLTAEQERGYNKMVGQTTQLTYLIDPRFADVDSACADGDVPAAVCAPRNALPETTLYIPLQFWFCRNPGLALPLIALQYHEVRINLELRPSDEVLFAVNALKDNTSSSTTVKSTASYQKSLVAASLYVDYVFLDTDERRRMAQNPHEYLIEQLQFTGDESVGSSSNKIKLNFNHPCKELIFVVQPDQNVDYCASFLSNTPLNQALGAQPFNYTDALDALVNSIGAFSGPGGAIDPDGVGPSNAAVIGKSGMFQDPGADTLGQTGMQWGRSGATTATTDLGGLGMNVPVLALIETAADDEVESAATKAVAVTGITLTAAAGSAIAATAKVGAVVPAATTAANTRVLPDTGTAGAVYTYTLSHFTATSVAVAGTTTTTPEKEAWVTLVDDVIAKNDAQVTKAAAYVKARDAHTVGKTSLASAETWAATRSAKVPFPIVATPDSGVSDAGAFVLAETALSLHCWGQNPVVTAKLQLNGQDRFSEREGTYFDLVQPFQHHTRSPDTGINVYSFALRPEEHQPSGTCNFSRIDNATLQLVLSSNAVGGADTAKVRVYATNYNVLRIMSGMGGLAYSN